MRKSILITVLVVMLSASMVAGATYAWFTAAAEPIVNEFTAGTVEISVEETQTPEVFMMENWNPGDCGQKIYTIINIGSKGIYLRARFTGAWFEHDGVTPWTPDPDEQVVTWGFCPEVPAQNWTQDGEYFYYNDPIKGTYTEPDESLRTVTLCIAVCLDGPKTGNQYQGKVFKLIAEYEAVQSSNGAVDDEWPDNPYTVVVVPSPTPTAEPTPTPTPTTTPTPPSGEVETAWAGSTPFGTGIAKYFTYHKGEGTFYSPKIVGLYVGADLQNVGYVKVWNTSDKIYYTIRTTDSNKLEFIHSYIGLEVPLKSAPGKLGYSYDTDGPVNEFAYNATYVFEDNASDPGDRTVKLFRDVYFGQAVQIAIHAEIVD